jgi:hypothetical protein
MAAKGQAKTGGRRKGTPNKLNADVKAMILAALNAKGGQKYLEKQADENPMAFLTLVGKILPLQMSATVKHDLSELTDAELIAIASAGHDGTVGEADSAQAKGEQPSLH